MTLAIAETFRCGPSGWKSRPAKAGHQPRRNRPNTCERLRRKAASAAVHHTGAPRRIRPPARPRACRLARMGARRAHPPRPWSFGRLACPRRLSARGYAARPGPSCGEHGGHAGRAGHDRGALGAREALAAGGRAEQKCSAVPPTPNRLEPAAPPVATTEARGRHRWRTGTSGRSAYWGHRGRRLNELGGR